MFARLRFVSELARAGETFFAASALREFQAPDTARAVTAVKRLRTDLDNGRVWDDPRWDTGDLVPPAGEEVTDVQARHLWGVAMAMLLAAAELPTASRVQAIRELADLGHHDEAEWIARGVLRDRQADPALAAGVRAFLPRAAGGTPGPTGAGFPAPPRSGPGSPPT